MHAVAAQRWNSDIYSFFIAAGVAALLLFNLMNCKHFGIPTAKAMTLTLLVVIPEILMAFVLHWVFHGFSSWGGKDLVRVFIWAPLFAYFAARILKLEWAQCCDYLAPCLPLFQGVSHFGCMFGGCCYGYEWKYGIYNHVFERNLFPVQAAEALVGLAIAAFIWIRQKKNGYEANGTSYPLMLILFGFTRFLLEFARNNQKIAFGISEGGFHALFMALLGLAVYLTLTENQDKKRKKQKRRTH